MRNTLITLTLGAVVLAGCSSTSGRTTAASSASATTGPSATDARTPPTPTPTPARSQARPTAGTTAHSTGAPRSGQTQPQPLPQELVLTKQGLGSVPVGAGLEKFAEAFGAPTPMSATDRSVFADHSCVIRQLSGVRGVGLMVIGDNPGGQVRRIGITAGSAVRTDTGIGLGSSLDAVRSAYGPGLDEPFDHFPVGGDAVLVRAGANRYLAFIGDERDRVVELRLGFRPEVLNPEGCV